MDRYFLGWINKDRSFPDLGLLPSPNRIEVDRPIRFDLYRFSISSIFFELRSLEFLKNLVILNDRKKSLVDPNNLKICILA